MITPTEFREQNLKRARVTPVEAHGQKARLIAAALLMGAEAGAIADEVKKIVWHDKPLDQQRLADLLTGIQQGVNVAVVAGLDRHAKTPHLTSERARPALCALGIAGEAGEVLDAISEAIVADEPFQPERIINEVGDLLWYVDRLLHAVGATLEDAMQANVDKLAARYPDGFDKADKKYGFTKEEGA